MSLRTLTLIDGPLARANGMTAAGGAVMISRMAVQHFTRAEVDALLAHELAHMKLRHVEARAQRILLMVLPEAFIAAPAFLFGRYWIALGVILLCPLLTLTMAPMMRRQETEADSLGVEIVGDARSMVRLHASLARVNKQALTLGRIRAASHTHPAQLKRILALSAKYAVSEEEVARILAEAGPDAGAPAAPLPLSERYPLPEEQRYVSLASAFPTFY